MISYILVVVLATAFVAAEDEGSIIKLTNKLIDKIYKFLNL